MPSPSDARAVVHHVTVNGVRHAYRTIGSGPPVVLLHGGPGMWHDELLPYFDDLPQDHELFFYDQRGNGGSPLAQVTSATFTVDLLVADLEALRQAWGLDRITIVGHSWGGLLAMEYGVRHPDRLDRLVLVDSAPTSPELLRESYRVLVGRMPEGAWGRLEELYASDAYLAGDPSAHNEAMRLSEGATFHVPSAREEYFRLVAFDGPRARNMAALAGPAQGIKDAVGVAAGLARITCPTLVVYGAQDFIVPAARRRLAEQLPDARLVEIPECGHYPFIEQPGTFAAELRRFVTAAPRDPMAR